ncbi:hypothetical protein TRFO_19525 [Tritrichomonas foetus]|uniref:Uncharacterized protein n=1 Tax=Tritrichomonas foetus TaxID=1144522 RepID=A0A1J4KHT6_9EUKA|nr:hypothetical protein TRFO_19525 [Tritrichomonas foetus]|eukprot:OHT10953.1 hypothetical protein TRFO_19525 [Tritrichomonas foetus]
MKRFNIDESILKSISFEIVVPFNPARCFDKIETCETRDWAIPGEKLFFFLKASASILQLNSLSFSVFANKKQVRSRRSTLLISSTTNFTDQYIEPTETKTHHKLPSMSPFRLPDGTAIYPLFVQIPITLMTAFDIEVFIPRVSRSVAKKEIHPVFPFSVTFKQHQTTLSSIAQFFINISLKGQDINELDIESTNIGFDTRPPHNEEDFKSNIQIVKPCNLKCKICDDQNLSSVFLLSPLTENGALMLTSNLVIHFLLSWRIKELSFTSSWIVEMKTQSIGLTMLLPPVTTKALTTTTVPLRITNLKEARKNLELIFDGGAIQPVAQRIQVPEIPSGSSVTMNISFLPLSAGYHQLRFWAEENGKRIDPLFPTYINVVD